MNRFAIISIAFALATPMFGSTPALAELYRYVDAQGEVHIVSDPYMIPEEYRDAAVRDAATRSGGSLNVLEDGEPSEPGAAAAGSSAPGATATQDTVGGHDEMWWREKSMMLHDRVDELERAVETAREDEDDHSGESLSPVHGGRPSPAAHATPHQRDRRHRAARISDDDYYEDGEEEPSVGELEAELAKAERDLEAFEDQARRAGVPPGWLR